MSDPTAPALAPGQVWRFEKAPSPDAMLIVGAITEIGETVVAHVAVFNLPAPEDADEPDTPVMIGHIPFEIGALQASLTTLQGEADPPELLLNAAQEWEDDVEAGDAPIVTFGVAETLRMIYEEADNGSVH